MNLPVKMATPNYLFKPMSEENAREVAAWRYEPPYDFYDMTRDPQDLEELLDPERRQNYYAVLLEEGLVGFFSFGVEAQVPSFGYSDDSRVDVGLGLRPDLTGKGCGLQFVLAGLEFARSRFTPLGFRLSVATFNERAIRVYERAGFQHVEVFAHRTGGSVYPFLLMKREA